MSVSCCESAIEAQRGGGLSLGAEVLGVAQVTGCCELHPPPCIPRPLAQARLVDPGGALLWLGGAKEGDTASSSSCSLAGCREVLPSIRVQVQPFPGKINLVELEH